MFNFPPWFHYAAGMNQLARVFVSLTFGSALLLSGGAFGAQAPSAKRILILGDSITYGGRYVDYFETYLRGQFPGWEGEVLNLGLPSETVSGLSEDGHAGGAFPRPDLHERLDRVLAKTKPDLVIACYGMNDGIYLPLSEERFGRFKAGIERLRAKVTATGAQMIHLTPPVYDPVTAKAAPGFNYDDVLASYSEWLLSKRADDWTVLDIHGPMRECLREGRARDPQFQLAGDGVHPGDVGHWLMARPLIAHFGAPAEWAKAATAETMLQGIPHGGELLKLVAERQSVLKDAWLTDTGHQRPGMGKGLPLAEAEQRAAKLQTQIRELLKSR